MIVGGVCHVQVVAEQPVAGLLPPVGLRVGVRQPLGVQAHQVMHPPPARRTGTASTRCARASPASTLRTSAAGRSASTAAAAVDTSGPGLTGSSRNTRAGISSSLR